MNDGNVTELLTKTNELLSVLVKSALGPAIAAELDDEKKKQLYDLTGGSLPIKELATKVGMSTGAISRAWQKWEDAGLLVKRNGKYRRVLE